jgi:hypothetical protein
MVTYANKSKQDLREIEKGRMDGWLELGWSAGFERRKALRFSALRGRNT